MVAMYCPGWNHEPMFPNESADDTHAAEPFRTTCDPVGHGVVAVAELKVFASVPDGSLKNETSAPGTAYTGRRLPPCA